MINIKTLAAVLALTVAGAAHAAKCGFHTVEKNLSDESVHIHAWKTCKPGGVGCKALFININYEIGAGGSWNGVSDIRRKSDTKILYYIQDDDGNWHMGDRVASCKDTSASPVVVLICPKGQLSLMGKCVQP